jgi:hypothetical protein
VGVEFELGGFAHGFDDGKAETDIRHEVSVHDIEVEQVGATFFHAGDFFGQSGEVGG